MQFDFLLRRSTLRDLGLCEFKRNFSYGFFNNDWRNIRSDKSPDLLGIETGQFGFVLNVRENQPALKDVSVRNLNKDADSAPVLEAMRAEVDALLHLTQAP